MVGCLHGRTVLTMFQKAARLQAQEDVATRVLFRSLKENCYEQFHMRQNNVFSQLDQIWLGSYSDGFKLPPCSAKDPITSANLASNPIAS